MQSTGLVLFATLVLAGCAATPPVPTFETKRGDRVGLLVEIGEGPLHTHVGTTVFNNFEKKYPHQWNLDAAVTDVLRKSLSSAGFAVVDLESEGVHYADVVPLVVADGEKWKLAPGKESLVRELIDRKNLRAAVVLKETRVMTALECSGGPCSERYANASGMYTRSFLGATRYNAVAAFSVSVYVLDPPTDLAKVDPLRTMMRIPAVPLGNYPKPVNFDNITEAEFGPVRDAIVRFTEQLGTEIAKRLNPSE